ncbi:hypothetical protein JKP88DRAFT_36695 [Tribonema minus]|uniref:Secreted protein n=1 Tax=Tribonema minus TaxID=303371 RepID=A0A835Z443_9STRA|nr:hypothetical protein JKP88DRAFT_36695 [Tribonema minus]
MLIDTPLFFLWLLADSTISLVSAVNHKILAVRLCPCATFLALRRLNTSRQSTVLVMIWSHVIAMWSAAAQCRPFMKPSVRPSTCMHVGPSPWADR